jgi:dTMP kinase
MQSYPGLFISLEGCEGCGKSTQARLLHQNLIHADIASLLTQEPGGTPLGNRIRNILKVKRDFNISPTAELFLFAACRSQLVTDVLQPALQAGNVVVCDRFSDSTVVYQGYARGLDLHLIESINNIATGGLKPDLTILLDTQPEQGLKRKRNSQADRFEAEDISFHRKIREGYLALAREEPGRWLVVPAKLPVKQLSRLIWENIWSRLKMQGQAKDSG